MPCYVDHQSNQYGRMKMCHLIADTPDELHMMARRVGMMRQWYQPKSFPHYDLAKFRRVLAVKAGAIEVTGRELALHMRRIRASGAFASLQAD